MSLRGPAAPITLPGAGPIAIRAGSLARQATGLAAAAARSRQVRACSSTDPPLLPGSSPPTSTTRFRESADTCAQASDEADHGM